MAACEGDLALVCARLDGAKPGTDPGGHQDPGAGAPLRGARPSNTRNEGSGATASDAGGASDSAAANSGEGSAAALEAARGGAVAEARARATAAREAADAAVARERRLAVEADALRRAAAAAEQLPGHRRTSQPATVAP